MIEFRLYPGRSFIVQFINTHIALVFLNSTKKAEFKTFEICSRLRGEPVLQLGPVAAGRQVALDDQLRQEFSRRNGIVAFNTELDAVVESIYGNRKDQVGKH